MQMTSDQREAQVRVDELLVKVGLAAPTGNSGFQCFLGSGSQRPYGSDEAEFRVELAAHRSVYTILDSSSLPFLFTAVELNGAPEVTRLVLSDRNRTVAKVRSAKVFKQFAAKSLPLPLVELEPLLIKVAKVIDARLAELELEASLSNRISLANLLWASSSNRVMYREMMDLGLGPIDWLRAGVNIEHILYAWSSGGWNYVRAEPALPLTEAEQLKGVPLNRIKALYPQVTGRP